jgi:hypothetical protein
MKKWIGYTFVGVASPVLALLFTRCLIHSGAIGHLLTSEVGLEAYRMLLEATGSLGGEAGQDMIVLITILLMLIPAIFVTLAVRRLFG